MMLCNNKKNIMPVCYLSHCLLPKLKFHCLLLNVFRTSSCLLGRIIWTGSCCPSCLSSPSLSHDKVRTTSLFWSFCQETRASIGCCQVPLTGTLASKALKRPTRGLKIS